MSQARFPDPVRSRAVLIGASHFTTAGPDLPDIPAVAANLTALRQVLTSPDTGVLRPEHCRSLADPISADEVGAALSTAAASATDLLLVYYAGHGLVDDRGRLHLALADTLPDRIRWTALPLDLLREEIAASGATTRVLVLDCCFSGRAIETMTDAHSVISGQLDVAGTYTLTSTTANVPAHAPFGERYTAFTGALLSALDEPDPLTLDQIYSAVDNNLAARNLPRPQRRAINTAGDLALSHGPTTTPHTQQTDTDEVRFTRTYRSLIELGLRISRVSIEVVLRTLGAALSLLPVYIPTFMLLFAPMSSIIGDVYPKRSITFYFVPISLISLILTLVLVLTSRARTDHLRSLRYNIKRFVSGNLYAIKRLVYSKNDDSVREFVVDRSGFTIRWTLVRIHIPWQNIAQVGVLYLERGSSNQNRPAILPKRKNILVVRLRPDVPVPRVRNVLSDEHRRLGYLGLCAVESLGSSRQEMTRALEGFAGGKLAHNPRQFLDRDPRLRPDMV